MSTSAADYYKIAYLKAHPSERRDEPTKRPGHARTPSTEIGRMPRARGPIQGESRGSGTIGA
eukprot:scaffold8717_cov59-Cyclotella_meneghiniana.AAC.7